MVIRGMANGRPPAEEVPGNSRIQEFENSRIAGLARHSWILGFSNSWIPGCSSSHLLEHLAVEPEGAVIDGIAGVAFQVDAVGAGLDGLHFYARVERRRGRAGRPD